MGVAISAMEYLETVAEWFERNRRKLATVSVAALALMVGWHVLFGANGMMVYQHKKAEYQKLQIELQELQAENKQLEEKVERLRSDPKTIEREAREQLRYARPGEVIYTVPQPPETQPGLNAKKQ